MSEQAPELAGQTPEPGAAAAVEAPASSLADLLKEFEPTPEAPAATPAPVKPEIKADEIRAAVDYVNQARSREVKQSIQQAVTDTVANVKTAGGEGLTNVPDAVIKGLLHLEADSDPAFLTAFNSRTTNPEVWKRIEKAFAEKVASTLGSVPNQEIGQSRAAVQAAIGGVMSKSPPAQEPDMKDWSGQRIADWIKTQARAGNRNTA
jgi:hypothetical protein